MCICIDRLPILFRSLHVEWHIAMVLENVYLTHLLSFFGSMKLLYEEVETKEN